MAETPNRTTLDALAELEAGKGERFDMAELCRDVKFSRYDTADYLKTEDGDPALLAAALGDVTRARARIANAASTKREE